MNIFISIIPYFRNMAFTVLEGIHTETFSDILCRYPRVYPPKQNDFDAKFSSRTPETVLYNMKKD